MKYNRRIKRMARNKKRVIGLNLTPLMDVFTILVFFLLFHSTGSNVVEAPRQVSLPESTVETKPKETVVILVSPEVVLVQGEAVIGTPELIGTEGEMVAEITERLEQIERNIIGISTKTIVQSKEVTILADKSIPFSALKRIMSTCTGSGYERISLAVIQKSAQS